MLASQDRRILCLWFPRLASDRALRLRPVEGPFALTARQSNTDRLHCLNRAASRAGLTRGMPFADARAFCPDLLSRPADPPADRRFLRGLGRWATRYCPWVGLDQDGLVLDITGATHLMGSEDAMLEDMRARLTRAGLSATMGLADTKGAAWALSRHGGGQAPPGDVSPLHPLPVEALRLDPATAVALQRAGLRRIGDLLEQPRAPLARRFGAELMLRLDQALGAQPEQVSPLPEPPHFGVRLSLPDPIGLEADVMQGVARLLEQLCRRLAQKGVGAQILRLYLRRVDQDSQEVELRLARPLREAERILPLFARGIGAVEAGYGIDQMRLEAAQVVTLPAQQLATGGMRDQAGLEDLMTRLGTRIGLENIQRFLPAESHIPERSFMMVPAAYNAAVSGFAPLRPRPLRIFPPEPVDGADPQPPQQFRWRGMSLGLTQAEGPERITPEWWLDDPQWRSGLRDYWRVQTRQGRRLWMFYTPQTPGWAVQGEFP